MNATLTTRQIRLVALLVLVVVAAGGYMVVTKHKATTQTTKTTASSTPTRTTHATTTPTPSKTHSHSATATRLRTHGLPVSVARALRKHSVVVVTLTTPRGEDDQFTRSEAQAGAQEMNAGYVAIDVFHQRSGTAILHKLGVVDTPEILVVRRPGTITSQFKGFVDRDVVAQAVADAR
jgi:thiol:disulfide interchange protein